MHAALLPAAVLLASPLLLLARPDGTDAAAPPCKVGAVADPSLAQPGPADVVDPHPPATLVERRARIAAELGDGVLLLAAGPDGKGRFEVHPDFLYLAGLEVPGAVLALVVVEGELELERVYLPERSERRALWDGPLLGPGEEASERTGIADTRGLARLEADLDELLAEPAEVFALVEQRDELFGRPPEGREVSTSTPRDALNALQAVKDAHGLAALEATIDITLAALADGFCVARAGAFEFQVEAAVEAGFRRRGAPFRAFPSICASGPNATVLHYRESSRRMQAGELLLLDVGAKLHGYCADISRTIPVDGTFDERQRELYDLVVKAHDAAAAALRPGVTLRDAHVVARDIFAEAGLAEAFKHSVGHHLGLRTHDVPGLRGPLEEGMVVTIEPGLYLPEEAIGIRIENDYVITADGARLLSGALPYHTDELEAYLARIRAQG